MSNDCNQDRRRFLGTAAMMVLATQLGMSGAAKGDPTRAVRLSVEGEMPSLAGATGWLNSQPLTSSSLRGKVVLIDFWTYTCVNWRRTLPYVRAWATRYSDKGLTVIGVHTPEFPFERDLANVSWALKDMRIEYPVAMDSDYRIWNAFNNEYWPALYFVDAKGHIRHHQFGEGDYGQSEIVLRQLLSEAGAHDFDYEPLSIDISGAEVAADWASLRSLENYVGSEHTEGFASPGSTLRNKPHIYVFPTQLELNHWALSGDWTAGSKSILLNQANGRIAYRFHARDLNLVMGSTARGASVPYRVLLNGQPPGATHGVDVDGQGNGTVIEQRLYQLIRQSAPVADRNFEIEFLDANVETFDFTFG